MFLTARGRHSRWSTRPTADGVFSLAWLVIALPLAGAAILLIGGALFPKPFHGWGHLPRHACCRSGRS